MQTEDHRQWRTAATKNPPGPSFLIMGKNMEKQEIGMIHKNDATFIAFIVAS